MQSLVWFFLASIPPWFVIHGLQKNNGKWWLGWLSHLALPCIVVSVQSTYTLLQNSNDKGWLGDWGVRERACHTRSLYFFDYRSAQLTSTWDYRPPVADAWGEGEKSRAQCVTSHFLTWLYRTRMVHPGVEWRHTVHVGVGFVGYSRVHVHITLLLLQARTHNAWNTALFYRSLVVYFT